jgi:hypothetical protein
MKEAACILLAGYGAMSPVGFFAIALDFTMFNGDGLFRRGEHLPAALVLAATVVVAVLALVVLTQGRGTP